MLKHEKPLECSFHFYLKMLSSVVKCLNEAIQKAAYNSDSDANYRIYKAYIASSHRRVLKTLV